MANGQGLHARKDRGAGVTLALGIAPYLVVARQVDFYLALLQLGFLQGDYVGIKLVDDVGKAGVLL